MKKMSIKRKRPNRKKMIIGQKVRALRSSAIYSLKAARRSSKIDYYRAMGQDIKAMAHRESEKLRLRTPKWEYVSDLLKYWKDVGGGDDKSVTGKILLGIYNSNKEAALHNGPPPVHHDLLSVLARPETLLMAYKKIQGNDGAFTKGSWYSKEDWQKMDPESQLGALRGQDLPDGMSIASILFISSLIKKGLYPWGVSRRIYVEKPGTTALRPLTIPPFMDRIVQQAILSILESIFEPWFEVRNRSFGFRPNKGCHDAITALKRYETNGMHMAVEGDIKGAFNKVDKEILLGILEKRIKDKKFIDLMRNRLNYEFTQGTGADFQRIRETEGTPQGGIESPYLWNIYMSSFDEFVHNDLQRYIDSLNIKHGFPPVPLTSDQSKTPLNSIGRQSKGLLVSYKRKTDFVKKMLFVNKYFLNRPVTNTLPRSLIQYDKAYCQFKDKGIALPLGPEGLLALRKQLFVSIRTRRLLVHRRNNRANVEKNKAFIRIFYVRYADDWILLFNGDTQLGNKLKSLISVWLKDNLKATLSDEKTTVTNMKTDSAHFLGYELRVREKGWLKYIHAGPRAQGILRRQRTNIKVSPDKQRLITRLHTRGYCTPTGFPREMPWLSCLESFTIIERFNAVLRGLANYYNGYTSYKSDMNRWIYIIRYSCLKTLAQKYKSTISKIFNRFGTSDRNEKTVAYSCTVRLNDGQEYVKTWRLLTYHDLLVSPNQTKRVADLAARFNQLEKKKSIGNYPLAKGAFPKVTNLGFLDKITWVNTRTHASLDMPCTICGLIGDTQMHHINHVRNVGFAIIPASMPWKQLMNIKNRRQLPVCGPHHKMIHAKKYDGLSLKRVFDSRIIHVGSFVKPGVEHHAKSLTEKGWRRVVSAS